jgi:hypothetical protein
MCSVKSARPLFFEWLLGVSGKNSRKTPAKELPQKTVAYLRAL